MTDDVPVIHVDAGEIHLCHTPTILRTVLGSCVGVTFWNARVSVGALCHAALPLRPGHWSHDEAYPEGYRYVDVCIRYLIRQFDKLGLKRGEVVVKLFGGGDVLPVFNSARRQQTVGWKNRIAALQVLEKQGISPMAVDLGGTRGRVISFHTGTGEVTVRRLQAAETVHLESAARLRRQAGAVWGRFHE